MKVFITKYALTTGLEELEVETTKFPNMVKAGYHTFHKPFWHQTKEKAIKHAEEMRMKKIASLKKQINKIEKIIFS